MEINGKSIRGMFVYDPDVEFERGDFVIQGDVIYIAKRNVTGVAPIEDIHGDYYKTYLLDAIATDEDFKDYAVGTGDDKFVSMRSLGNILGSYMAGFNEKGLICNTATTEGIELRNFFDASLNVPTNGRYLDVLDQIMTSPELNNCTFVVSRGVADHVLEVSSIDSTETGDVLLRQYTYEDEAAGDTVRVQELVDYENGILRYRYSRGSIGYDLTNISWSHVTVSDGTTTYISKLESYYQSEINKMRNMEATLKGMFRFFTVKCESDNGSYTIQKSSLIDDGAGDIDNDDKDDKDIFLSFSFIDKSGLHYDFKTVNVKTVIKSGVPLKFYIMDSLNVEVLIEAGLNDSNEVTSLNITTGSDTKIIDVYGRREYNQEYDLDENIKQLTEDISGQ